MPVSDDADEQATAPRSSSELWRSRSGRRNRSRGRGSGRRASNPPARALLADHETGRRRYRREGRRRPNRDRSTRSGSGVPRTRAPGGAAFVEAGDQLVPAVSAMARTATLIDGEYALRRRPAPGRRNPVVASATVGDEGLAARCRSRVIHARQAFATAWSKRTTRTTASAIGELEVAPSVAPAAGPGWSSAAFPGALVRSCRTRAEEGRGGVPPGHGEDRVPGRRARSVPAAGRSAVEEHLGVRPELRCGSP
ncbi:hypothetical protein ShzoTeo12_53750 (plasmid) [Shinella zoogloeoides]|nr:hypothetical protein ShzoTeo12_53750 [Shinella zoogloeoides]